MMISGLTILKNVMWLGYPFQEAIRSVLPICDEFLAVVGKSEDGTLEAVRELKDPKIRIVETVWSDKVKPRGCLLAQQTNIGLHLCEGDWVIYLQANEVLHESCLPGLVRMMAEHKDNLRVEALLLERLTFWADYSHYLRAYPDRFKYSPRIVRPYLGTYSIRDAMSFAVFDRFSTRGRYPRALDTGVDLYRYGYVGRIEQIAAKLQKAVHFGNPGEVHLSEAYYYQNHVKSLVAAYPGSHPEVMRERVKSLPPQIRLGDPRWRVKPNRKERQRLLETWYYERFGVPWFRNTRYRLVGGYVKKNRLSNEGS